MPAWVQLLRLHRWRHSARILRRRRRSRCMPTRNSRRHRSSHRGKLAATGAMEVAMAVPMRARRRRAIGHTIASAAASSIRVAMCRTSRQSCRRNMCTRHSRRKRAGDRGSPSGLIASMMVSWDSWRGAAGAVRGKDAHERKREKRHNPSKTCYYFAERNGLEGDFGVYIKYWTGLDWTQLCWCGFGCGVWAGF